MTHELRLGMAERLRDAHPHLDIRVVCDTGPLGERGSLRSARRAWAAAAPWATHHLVLQDDVRLTGNFLDLVGELIEHYPEGVSSLFVEWGSWTASVARVAALCGAGWAEVVDDYVPTQAVVMPVALAKDVSAWFEEALGGDEPDDVTLRRYLRSAGLTPQVAVPNAVEHRDATSLTGNSRHGMRCATCWTAGATSLSGVDPRRSVTGIDAVPVLAWWGEPGAYFRFRDPTTDGGWRKVPALAALADLGFGEDHVLRLAGDALRRERDTGHARRLIGEHLLSELWLAAFGLGVCAAAAGASPAGEGMETRVGRRALGTMALGAVRNRVPRPLFAKAAAVLTPVVRDAVRVGLAV
ncbi:hypothetical protein RI578_42220 (plasmid) [Streptomyces sp. BB1-1-1]|uniref:hypothetical protein n=1 Tax=Streptomyces sp. BB1-1-1 TaxID=3074430 RepID=UPI00287755C7|nr:hypothetical protein [Streptomyces sp. BB1-1-1]WND32869.1 hypothetical protein RI578_00415 [Streptomyces sp. BB1-1-1]WND40062.1 hypothetical protein RI578_39990 [Streptomyces sp. BB1-1-1]WND40897.1 hypothetical protein RI578_42220 [Streptomyces sp. BB1-1-1]